MCIFGTVRERFDVGGIASGLKRAFDIFCSVVALAVLSPLLAAIAAAIKVLGGPGPVIYRGSRIGRFGVEFHILKFRSMRAGSDIGAQLTAGSDSRVTGVGAFLRSTKLDELPQFWNVLRGQMSVVGPRPEAPRYVAHYTEAQRTLLLVRPGVTGAATLEYRNEEAVLAQVADDKREAFYLESLLPKELAVELEYVANWTFRRDLVIIARTLVAIVTGIGLGRASTTAGAVLPGRRFVPRSTMPVIALDSVMWVSGLVAGSILRHGKVAGVTGENLGAGIVIVLALLIAIGLLVGCYRGRFAIGRYQEAGALTVVQVLVVVAYFTIYVVVSAVPVGRGTVLAAAYWAIVPMLGVRYLFRYWRSRRVQPPAADSRRVLVYGAGLGAHQVIPSLLFNPSSRYRPVGIIEDDPSKRYRSVEGISVVGNRNTLEWAAARYHVDALLIAVPSASPAMIREITQMGHAAGLDVITLPPINDMFVHLRNSETSVSLAESL
jgi:lipopolysaccharide/colanic/teichoic acid biosynthesis glycosyltransferase